MLTKCLAWLAVGLCFLTALFLFFHDLTTINEDIGRHIKLGEIIWQIKSVPHTNLLSYTATSFPFINHHWLSEVIFYVFYHLGGLRSILVAKIIILLATYLILFLIVKSRLNSIAIFSFLLSLALISGRTDPRPEIFTYLLLSVFLFIVYWVRADEGKIKMLWFLPLLELFWVNLHIYFIIGYVVYGAFLLERFFLKKPVKREVFIGILLILATLVSPNGIRGALYPLTILKGYAVPIAENLPILDFVKYYHSWIFPYNLFLISTFIAAFGFFLRWDKLKNYLFELLLFIFFIISSFQVSRNISIYAIFYLPATVSLFYNARVIPKFSIFNKISLGGLIIFMIFFLHSIKTNAFYEKVSSPMRFGLNVPNFMQQAVDFFQHNNLPGPIFNDLGIGSYLEWKLYPVQKAFSDDRPEAYPENFWRSVYEPMQADQKIWKQKSTEYSIRSVLFDHTITNPAGQKFLFSMLTDPGWPLLYINDRIVIFVKSSKDTQQLINAYVINDRNIESRIKEVTDTFDPSYDLSYRNLGDFLYKIGQYKAALIPYGKLITAQPNNYYGYERHALTLAAGINKNGENNNLIINELKKAIDLGAGDANDYFVIAFLSTAKNDLTSARTAIQKAYRLNPRDQRIKSLYSQLEK